MGVCDLPVISSVCGGIGSVVSSTAWDAISAMASAMQRAEVDALASMMTFWAAPGTPTPTPSDAGDLGRAIGPTAFLQTNTSWFVGLFAVMGLLFAAGRMAWQRRVDPARQAFQGLVTVVLMQGAALGAVTLATLAGDGYSTWILDRALNVTGAPDFSTAATSLVSTASMTAMLMLLLSLFGVLAALAQIVLMIVRVAMLGLLAGLLPIAAATSITETGQGWLRKILAWLLAFTLYKPVAATIYAYAFVELKQGGNNVDQLAGLVMIILAVVALPALMRFIVPMVAPTTGGGSGGGAAMAGSALATGARMVPAGGGGASSGGDGGGGGSSGSAAPSQGSATGAAPASSGAAPAAQGAAGSSGAATAAGTGAAGAGAGSAGSAAAAAGAGAATAGAGTAVVIAAKAASGAVNSAVSQNTGEGGSDGIGG